VTQLTTCVLFMAFEMMQDNLASALELLTKGLSIVRTWRYSEQYTASASERELVDDCLLPIFTRFIESSDVSNDDLSALKTQQSASLVGHDPYSDQLSTAKFFNLSHASTSLHAMLDRLFLELELRRDDRTTDKETLFAIHNSHLNCWHQRFEELLEQCQADTNRGTRRRMCLLELQFLVAKVLHAGFLFENEMIYDDHLPTFERIIELCDRVIALDALGSSRMAFSFDMGIIMPLFLTAAKCRDPLIRRKAHSRLAECPRREGIFLSWVTGYVAKLIISVEEENIPTPITAADVPHRNRTSIYEMAFDPHPAPASGPCDQASFWRPVLKLKFTSRESMSDPLYNRERVVQLPRTNDAAPGQRPYKVLTPMRPEFGHWKVLMGRKIFCDDIG
jgi:hypothetical protein